MDMAVVCGRHVGGLEPVHFKSVDLQKRALDFRVARRQQEDFAARMNALKPAQEQRRLDRFDDGESPVLGAVLVGAPAYIAEYPSRFEEGKRPPAIQILLLIGRAEAQPGTKGNASVSFTESEADPGRAAGVVCDRANRRRTR